MAKLVFVLLCLAFAVANVYCKDATLTPHSSGEAVVDAVIDKIHESCIFPNDKYFMKRIAAVNTDYGENMAANNGGIWKVSNTMIRLVNYYCRTHLRRYCDAALRVFNINIITLTRANMDIPMNSGLMMRLYLRLYMSDIPASKRTQAWIWVWLISKSSWNTFMNKVVVKQACFSPKMDLIFAIDASGSVGRRDFARTLKFLKDLVATLNIAPNLVRVAVIRYSSGASVSFHLDDYNDATSVNQAIDAITYTGGGTNTALALKLASPTFKSDRPHVPKILILITDGYSNNRHATVNAAKLLKDQKITIFAIGIRYVRDSEMQSVASSPSCTHFFKLSSYQEIDAITHQIQRKACEAPIMIDGTVSDAAITDNKIPDNKQIKEQLLFVGASNTNNKQTTIRVSVACGKVDVYISNSYSKPTPVLHDDMDTAVQGISAWIHSDPRLDLHINLVSRRLMDSTNPHCTNPHYNISINPTSTHIEVICRENGVDRVCTDGDIKEAYKHLFDGPSANSISNPCTNEHIKNNKMRFAHPIYNNMYIQCKITGSMQIVICERGANYNKQLSRCNPHILPPTTGSTIYTGPNPCTSNAMLGGNFYFANPTDPTTFIQCDEQGVAFLVVCPANNAWSQAAMTCVVASYVSNNPCNSSSGVFYYDNPTDSSTFIQCDEYDNPAVMPCPPATAWVEDKGACLPVSQNVIQSCINGEYSPFPEDEHSYYQCDNGVNIKRSCANPTVWSQVKLTCDHPPS